MPVCVRVLVFFSERVTERETERRAREGSIEEGAGVQEENKKICKIMHLLRFELVINPKSPSKFVNQTDTPGQNLVRSPHFCTFKDSGTRAALPARPRALPADRTGGGTSRGVGTAIWAVGAGSSGRTRRLRRAPCAGKNDVPDHESEPNPVARRPREANHAMYGT